MSSRAAATVPSHWLSWATTQASAEQPNWYWDKQVMSFRQGLLCRALLLYYRYLMKNSWFCILQIQ